MRKIVCLFVLCAAAAIAQPPQKQAADSPDQLKVQLAQANLQVAQLQEQLHQLQAEVMLYRKSYGVTDQFTADQKAVEDAQDALYKAQSAAEAASAKADGKPASPAKPANAKPTK